MPTAKVAKGGSKKDAVHSVKPVAKRRPKSPEIFAHNMKVLRKKSAMRRRKLVKEVKIASVELLLKARQYLPLKIMSCVKI